VEDHAPSFPAEEPVSLAGFSPILPNISTIAKPGTFVGLITVVAVEGKVPLAKTIASLPFQYQALEVL
jgi:hypothetical protein